MSGEEVHPGTVHGEVRLAVRAGSPAGRPEPIRRRSPASSPHSSRTFTAAAAISSSIGAARERHAIVRSKSAGRRTGSPLNCTEVTRLTRKARRPRSVWATRYQAPALETRPSGSTVPLVLGLPGAA